MPDPELARRLSNDYCCCCRLLMNHYVVSMVRGEIGKVRCQTCYHEHDYQHGQESGKKEYSPGAFRPDCCHAGAPYPTCPGSQAKEKVEHLLQHSAEIALRQIRSL